MKNRISFYFILYLVLVVDVLAVLTERDRLVDDLTKAVLSPSIVVPEIKWDGKQPLSTQIQIKRGLTPFEKESMNPIVTMVDAKNLDPTKSDPVFSKGKGKISFESVKQALLTVGGFNVDSSFLPVTLNPDTNWVRGAIYTFRIGAKYRRTEIHAGRVDTLPGVVPPKDFTVSVGKIIEEGQLGISIEPPRVVWPSGVELKVKAYLQGVQDAKQTGDVRISGLPSPTKKQVGSGWVEYTWSALMPGKQEYRVTADLNRGMKGLDHAETKFSLEVIPPAWDPQPPGQLAGCCPTIFESRLRGIPTSEYQVELKSADGKFSEVLNYSARPEGSPLLPSTQWRNLEVVPRMIKSNAILTQLRRVIPVVEGQLPSIEIKTPDRPVGGKLMLHFNTKDGCGDASGVERLLGYEIQYPAGVSSYSKTETDTKGKIKGVILILSNIPLNETHLIYSISVEGACGRRRELKDQMLKIQ
jgi:hypothetical protein